MDLTQNLYNLLAWIAIHGLSVYFSVIQVPNQILCFFKREEKIN